MALLPYCVFLPHANAIPNTGIQNAPIQSLERAGLVAIYSELEPQNIPGDQFQAAALRFHEVVHAVFERQAVVPFRFPTFLAESRLHEHIDKESKGYLNFLRKHAEDVQMEVRLWIPEALQVKVGSGTEYIQLLANRMTHLKGASEYVQRISEEIVQKWKSNESRDAIRLFALIPRSRISDFRERFTEKPRPANVAMRVTGPWPASEFFSGSASRVPHNVLSITRGEQS
jgi:hypothetical protein